MTQPNDPHPWTKGSVISSFRVMHDLLGIKYTLSPRDPADPNTMQLVVSDRAGVLLYAISEDTNPYDLVKVLNLGIPTSLSAQAAMKMARSGGIGLEVAVAPVGFQFAVMDQVEIDGKKRMIWGAMGNIANIPSIEAAKIVALEGILTSYTNLQHCIGCQQIKPTEEGGFSDYPGYGRATMFICNICKENSYEPDEPKLALGPGEGTGQE